MTHLTGLTVLGALIVAASSAAAQSVSRPEEPGAVPIPHVRGVDALACEVPHSAARLSPTVARLMAEIGQSDLIVHVGTGRLPDNVNGTTRVVAARPGVRFVRVVLRIPRSTSGLMEVLGHELRHALEVASMPDVRDEASLWVAYARVGVAMERDGYFETDAAVETGRPVAREVARKR